MITGEAPFFDYCGQSEAWVETDDLDFEVQSGDLITVRLPSKDMVFRRVKEVLGGSYIPDGRKLLRVSLQQPHFYRKALKRAL